MNKRAINTGFAPTFTDETAKKEELRTCEWAGCKKEGEHKANRSPRHINDYVWYCTDHTREHNKSWNYFDGLSEDDVENEIRKDSVWQRPTWKLGSGPNASKAGINVNGFKIKDGFGVYEEMTGNKAGKQKSDNEEWRKHDTQLTRAYALFDLVPPASKEELKKKYKALVKIHHPDANGGDKKSEEKFKSISEAYQLIMEAFDSSLL